MRNLKNIYSTKNFFFLFLWMGFNFLKATEPLRGDSLLFTSKSLGVSGTYLIYFRKMKGQHILWYFYKPSRAFPLSRYFAKFSLKAIDITMVRENFEIYGVYITRKWTICKYVVFIPYVYLAICIHCPQMFCHLKWSLNNFWKGILPDLNS